MRHYINAVLLFLATVTPALAATETGGDSYLGIFAFMGFVATIIVLQAVPVIFMIGGMVKGLFGSKEPEQAKARE